MWGRLCPEGITVIDVIVVAAGFTGGLYWCIRTSIAVVVAARKGPCCNVFVGWKSVSVESE